MIRTRFTMALVLATTGFLWSSDAFAQGGRRGFGRGGLAGLAGMEPVQKELGVDSGAASKLGTLAADFRNEMEQAGLGRESFGQVRELRGADFTAKWRELSDKRVEVTRKLNEKFVPRLKEILTPEQFERLLQIHRQSGGSQVLAEPAFVKGIELTKDQQEKLSKLNQEYGQKQGELMASAFGGGGGDAQGYFAKVQDLNKERDAKAVELLTKEQQEKYTQLKGKAFDLTLLQQRRQ